MILAVGAIAVVLTTVVFGLLSASQSIQNTGSIRAVGVGVYTDSACTNAAEHIDWGALTPGATRNFTLYVRNEGTTAVVLTMTTNNWTSTQASNYLKLTWNRQSQTLSHQVTTPAMLTLRVFENVTGVDSFGFNIVVTGTEVA
jgi:hypothetical protein